MKVEKIVTLIDKAVQSGKSDTEIFKLIRDVVNDVPEFNIREKARAYLVIKKVYQMGWKPTNMQIKKLCVGINKVNEHSSARQRKNKLKTQMRENRANQVVFYLCSSHSNPAKDHKDWEGVIYVDRFWKNITGNDKRVAAYIRNHDTKTVQWVTGEPVYLITRPYCKHYFISLDTEEVLNNGLKSIKKNHPEANMGTHNIDYRKKFYKQRYRIHKLLGMHGEANRDKKIGGF